MATTPPVPSRLPSHPSRRSTAGEARAPSGAALTDRDLFDQSPADWDRDPVSTFDTWLHTLNFGRASADVYRAQWKHFADYLAARGLLLSAVEPAAISAFLAGLPVRKQQKARYLRVIERVFDRLYRGEANRINPARRLAVRLDPSWTQAASNRPTSFLSVEEREHVYVHLEQSVAALRQEVAALQAAGMTGESVGSARLEALCRGARDRARCGGFLLGGVKVGEASGLTVSCVWMQEGWLLIESPDDLRLSRRVRLTPLLHALFEQWLALRTMAGTAGALMFSSDASGRAMHKATVLRAIDGLLAAAGIPADRQERASPQTLRNTYGAELFDTGESDEMVAERMGYADVVSAQRLRIAWLAAQRR